MTRSVPSAPGGEPYRLGARLLDGADVRALARTVGEMAKRGMNSSAPVAGDPGAERVDVDYHGESLRMGVLRIKADTVAYGQTGDLTTLLQGAIWGMPTTLYRPATDLSAPATALGQAAATVERVRRR